MFGIHEDVGTSTKNRVDKSALGLREVYERECNDESKKRPLQHHRDGRCLAGTVA
jgi:hypothetical protein